MIKWELICMPTSLDDLEGMKYSQREVDFILYNWSLVNDEVRYPNDLDYLKSFYIYCLSNDKLMINPSFFKRKRLVVDIELISWFKDDLRAGLFLSAYMYLKYKYLNFIIEFYNNFLKDLVFNIDFFHENINTIDKDVYSKSFVITAKTFAIRQAFYMYKFYKTKPRDLSWLNQNNREQLNWAMEYLQGMGLLIQPYNFLPADNKESYIQICASIDALDLHPPSSKAASSTATKADDLPNHSLTNLNTFHTGYKNSEHKEKILSNMRNAWNQKVFRDKKPVKLEKQIKLPYGYNKKLDKIAEAYGENAIDSLKQILDKEYKDVVLPK